MIKTHFLNNLTYYIAAAILMTFSAGVYSHDTLVTIYTSAHDIVSPPAITAHEVPTAEEQAVIDLENSQDFGRMVDSLAVGIVKQRRSNDLQREADRLHKEGSDAMTAGAQQYATYGDAINTEAKAQAKQAVTDAIRNSHY